MIVEPNNQKVNFSFSGNLNYYIKSLKEASMIRLSSDEFVPPLLERPILKRFGLFFFMTPLPTHDTK
jgi:hypothetical protein